MNEVVILTTKELKEIHENEFEVYVNDKMILTGRTFEGTKSPSNINFCFSVDIAKEDYMKACEKVFDKLIVERMVDEI